jgi:tetratricopeptide (TPR) repeat protein
MKSVCLALVAAVCLFGADDALTLAYDALKAKDYDRAIAAFLQAVEANPARADIRKDLAYTYLKAGESEAARDQFGEAVRLDADDSHAAMEYGYLCYESREDAVVWKTQARRVFDGLRKRGVAGAEQAYQNIDLPLDEGIARWTRALELDSESFSAHDEVAKLAEQRDLPDLAAQHYLQAWKIMPSSKGTLVDLGRVLVQAGRIEEAHAAWLAASRGGETRAAEKARELLPQRYPYVYEFRLALNLVPSNVDLHRELGYLLLKMAENAEGEEQRARQSEAEAEFRVIVASAPNDLLSCAQLGFLYLARKDAGHAMPLLQRVMDGGDKDLANKVRTALHLSPELEKRGEPAEGSFVDVRLLAEKSYAAGYMKDALKYLTLAHEIDPDDYAVMLKLGFTENMLHEDESALVWFNLARASPDESIAAQARRAWRNLRPNFSKVRTTVLVVSFLLYAVE